ncbi:hypothetical protein GGI21_005572, partial [Coemansia aciculifera]
MSKIAELKRASADRLADELARCEERAAHKIDILARLGRRGSLDSSDSDEDAKEVATVSPRTAVRRAVSRAASKRANKVASVSAGERREVAQLQARNESLDAQVAALTAQAEFLAQARAADRDRRETLESALVDANERAAAAEARLMRLAAASSEESHVDVLQTQFARERAELLAQTAMLKAQLRDAETHARGARRAWETQELLPIQERLRVLVAAQASRGESADEELERACRDRDSAWAWWTREQERCSQLSAQNDVLMREIRHLKTTAAAAASAAAPPPLAPVVTSRDDASDEADDDDDDDGFCKISLRSVASATAINGTEPPSLLTTDLDRVVSKARVLVRVPKPQSLVMPTTQSARESSDSFRQSSSPPPAHSNPGRAKRVVSRVFQHFAPDSANPSSS